MYNHGKIHKLNFIILRLRMNISCNSPTYENLGNDSKRLGPPFSTFPFIEVSLYGNE